MKQKPANQYVLKSEGGKMYGPFRDVGGAAKWAHKHIRSTWGTPANWSILRVFKP